MANDPDRDESTGSSRPDHGRSFGTEETMVPASGRHAALASDETMAPSSDSMASLVSAETMAPTSGMGYAETGMGSGGFGGGGGSSSSDLAPGDRAGEYVVEQLIGEGGFGKVFAGVHPVIGKSVAIKVLHMRYSADPDIVSRFVAEARAVNQIGHEGIIDIFAFGSLPDGRQYYVMELLEGETLRELIQRRGRLDLEETVDLLRQVGGALDAAHAAGVAHRDFKPDNIFLSPRGDGWRVKLLDFGVAKLTDPDSDVDHRTATGASVGTPAYMAPEQVVGKNVGPRADIYAFGVVAFHMLTGQLPFAADSAFSIMTAHVNEPPPDPLTLVDSLPRGLEQVLSWAMAKAPDARPPSCLVFIDRLAALGTPRDAAPLTGPQPTLVGSSAARSTGSSKAPLAIVVVVLLALGGVGAWLLGQPDDPPPEEPVATIATPVPSEASDPPPAVADAAPEPDATPAPADAAVPQTVAVEITGLPEGAEVIGPDDSVLRAGDGAIELPRGADTIGLTFRAEGYDDGALDVVPRANMVLQVVMTKTAKAPTPRARRSVPRPTPAPNPKKPTGDELPDF